MARNVEIKAVIPSEHFSELRERASNLATKGPMQLVQTDTFFAANQGRLKLREFDDGTAELIAYERPDCEGPKTSNYVRSSCDGSSMKDALANSLGVTGVVQKDREVFLVDQTRIHLDQVEGLGTYLELEVVLGDADSVESGETIAQELMKKLGVNQSQLVSGAYFDLLIGANA
ncbi:MAG: class IV adenylate cyclase [Mariniblastus sp.]